MLENPHFLTNWNIFLLNPFQALKLYIKNFGTPCIVNSTYLTNHLQQSNEISRQAPTGPKKSKMAIKAQSIDNSLLNYHKNFQPDYPKNGWVMAKKRMPINGIIGIFREFSAHNSAKYQHF